MTTNVRVNGASRHVEEGMRLGALVESVAGGATDGVAVAVNGVVVPRATWKEREVHNDDDIEIVRAVQGG